MLLKLSMLVAIICLTACSTPSYVDQANKNDLTPEDWPNKVSFEVKTGPKDIIDCLRFEKLEGDEDDRLRKSLYEKLSRKVNEIPLDENGCEYSLSGTVKDHGTLFLAIISRVSLEASLKITKNNGEILWTGEHNASMNGGGIPLDPYSAIVAVYNAIDNAREEQTERVVDDLARRLISTMPKMKKENKELVIESQQIGSKPDHIEVVVKQELENKSVLKIPNQQPRSEKLVTYEDVKISLNKKDYKKAEKEIMVILSGDKNNTTYLNTLGIIEENLDKQDRAIAAYQICTKVDPNNGFAFYNMAMVYLDLDMKKEAIENLILAGKSYKKKKDIKNINLVYQKLKELT